MPHLPFAEPIFLNIHMIPDSGDHNDDKLYFFSREKSAESGSQKSVFARIGRVCLVRVCVFCNMPDGDLRTML